MSFDSSAPLAGDALSSDHVAIKTVQITNVNATSLCAAIYDGLSTTHLHQAAFEEVIVDGGVVRYWGPTAAFIDIVLRHSNPTCFFGLLPASWRMPAFSARGRLDRFVEIRAAGRIGWQHAPSSSSAQSWTHTERFCQWRVELENDLRQRDTSTSTSTAVTTNILPFHLASNVPCPTCPGQNRGFHKWLEAKHQAMQWRMQEIEQQVAFLDQRIAALDRKSSKVKTAASLAASAALNANASFALYFAAQSFADVASDTLLSSVTKERNEAQEERHQLEAKANRVQTRKWPRDVGKMLDFLLHAQEAQDWRQSWRQVCRDFPRHGLHARSSIIMPPA